MLIMLVCLTLCDPLERTIDAMIQVESGGNWNAIGDGGRSVGGLQIGRDYWTDGTRFLGVAWPYEAARDPIKARQVVRAYLLGYQRAGGYSPTPEVFAALHNGGPTGPKKKATKSYVKKILKVLDNQQTNQ